MHTLLQMVSDLGRELSIWTVLPGVAEILADTQIGAETGAGRIPWYLIRPFSRSDEEPIRLFDPTQAAATDQLAADRA